VTDPAALAEAGAGEPFLDMEFDFVLSRPGHRAGHHGLHRGPGVTAPVIICVATTGSLATKADNPAVPISVVEQVESTQEAWEAGAAAAHCHVRDDEGRPSSGPRALRAAPGRAQASLPGADRAAVHGRSQRGGARAGGHAAAPARHGLAQRGLHNFPTRVYENPPDLVDWLAAAMLPTRQARGRVLRPEPRFQGADMADKGPARGRAPTSRRHGGPERMPADRAGLDFMAGTIGRLFPGAPWCAAGHRCGAGHAQRLGGGAGGHLRTGLEDNVRMGPPHARALQRGPGPAGGRDRGAPWAQARDDRRGAGGAGPAAGVSPGRAVRRDSPPYRAPRRWRGAGSGAEAGLRDKERALSTTSIRLGLRVRSRLGWNGGRRVEWQRIVQLGQGAS
jgi:uncharacterized protein (DUF849 family)